MALPSRSRPALTATLVLAACLCATLATAERRGPRHQRRQAQAQPAPLPDLGAYRLVTVTDLTIDEASCSPEQASLTSELSDRLAAAIAESDELIVEVQRGNPLGRPDELVVTGTLVRARRGHRAARFFAGPLARSRLVVDFQLVDGGTGEELAAGRVKKLWAFPGWLGTTRGFQGLLAGACREVVDYLEEACTGQGSEAPTRLPTQVARAR